MIIYTPPRGARTIPVINLEQSFSSRLAERKRAAWEIHKTCRDTGFFYVSNHRVPLDALARQLAATRSFFDLPMETKREIDTAKSDCMRGYEPLMLQSLDDGAPPDLKESLMLGRELGPDHPYVQRKVPAHGPNQWPSGLPGFREQMES